MNTNIATEYEYNLQDQIATNVRLHAALVGLSKADISRLLNVSQPTVGRKWMGGRAWSLDEIQRLAEIFDIEPWELVKPFTHENTPEVKTLRAVPGTSSSYPDRDSNPKPTD